MSIPEVDLPGNAQGPTFAPATGDVISVDVTNKKMVLQNTTERFLATEADFQTDLKINQK